MDADECPSGKLAADWEAYLNGRVLAITDVVLRFHVSEPNPVSFDRSYPTVLSLHFNQSLLESDL